MRQEMPQGRATAVLPVAWGAFVLEVSARIAVSEEEPGGVRAAACGLSLCDGDATLLSFRLAARPERAEVVIGPFRPRPLETPADFDSGTWHLLRFEVDGTTARVLLDGLLRWEGTVQRPVSAVQLFTDSARASFAGFALTGGRNDLFLNANDGPPAGWQLAPDLCDTTFEWTPIVVTETSAYGPEKARLSWLERSTRAIKELRSRGIPVLGYTWFPMFTMIDWRYRFGRGPIEKYRMELGLFKMGDGSGDRWAATPLVDQMRDCIANPAKHIGELLPAAEWPEDRPGEAATRS